MVRDAGNLHQAANRDTYFNVIIIPALRAGLMIVMLGHNTFFMEAMMPELLSRPRGELCVMDENGDTKTIWDPDNPDEVEVARSTFQKLKKKGYLAYRVNKDGGKASAMAEFDPTAGKIIMSPPMAGG